MKVTVAVWAPALTAGSAAEKPMPAAQTSPADAVAALAVPTTSAAAGATGIAAGAVPPSPVPSLPPAGAVAEMPSGRSSGVNAVRWTVSVNVLPLIPFKVTRASHHLKETLR